MSEVRKRALVCQFGGAVGTLATLEDRGLDVLHELSVELGLEEPAISWHSSRDGWAEAIHWIAWWGQRWQRLQTKLQP